MVDAKKQEKPKRSNKEIKSLRGMKDILPEEQKYWEYVRQQARDFASAYGFQRIDPPFMEQAALFERSVGKTTDIIEKEMFSFVDAGGEKIALRPEATASIARAYIEHGMLNRPQPVKLFYIGPMFRHERPQAGRLRQFHQCGFEALGSQDPLLDAQVIFVTRKLLGALSLPTMVQINSIGCEECRPNYQKMLINYYRTKRGVLCDDCKKRMSKNPLRLLDCKEEQCQEIAVGAPQLVDYLCDECREHFMKVLDYLDELEVPYFLNHSLVRGLDYYTKTVFEMWPEAESEGRQAALAGGGRYDGLVELLGGRPTPACGVAIGLDRVIIAMKKFESPLPPAQRIDVFVAQLGEEAKKKSLLLFEKLRQAGIGVAESFSKDGLKAQLEAADKLKVTFALILGQKEIMDGTIMIRDMENGIQEVINFNRVVQEVEKRLARHVKTEINKNA